jgi:hypothetical protein
MNRVCRTVIALNNDKEAALYFDHIIPLTLARKRARNEIQPKDGKITISLDDAVLPPSLRNDDFVVALCHADSDIFNLSFSNDPEIRRVSANRLCKFLQTYDLQALPTDSPPDLITENAEVQSDINITLASLCLINADVASWDQILAFRQDAEACDKLRRLRVFAYDNYSGKSREYIQDDILKRVADHDEAVKRWGFETKHATLSMLLNSKTLAAAIGGSLISALWGAPLTALAAAAGGLGVELGRVALELSKRRFVLRSIMKDNPISYVCYAKSKLPATWD